MIELDLRDIHLPESVPWWPLAPGWWLLVLLIILSAVLVWWLRRPRRDPVRRVSLHELARIRSDYRAGMADRQVIAEISGLLRRILISYQGRATTAGVTGDAWRMRLAELAPQCGFSDAQIELLTHARYRREVECDIDALLRSCELWIRALPRGRPHAAT